MEKKCKKCEEIKPFEEYGKISSNKDGKSNYCKSCEKERGNKYYKDNKDIRKEYRDNNKDKIKEWRDNNKDIIKEKWSEYYNKHKERYSKRRKEYYIENKERELELGKKWYIENIDKVKENVKEWRDNNKDKLKEWRDNNKDKIKDRSNKYMKQRLKNDPIFKFQHNLMCNIRESLRLYKDNIDSRGIKKVENILGCSIDFFYKYIEDQFNDWMNWENQGLYNGEYNYGWDLDHIIPISSGKTLEEKLKLCHYTNYQPLCSKVNRYEKRDKII